MKKRRLKAVPRERPKGRQDKIQKIVGVSIMPYYGSNAMGFKGLPEKVEREDEEPWNSFYSRYIAAQEKYPPRTWIKFKYETKIVQHYATSK